MSAPMNCWEYIKCGREPGGDKAVELGVCPAAVDTEYDGINRGTNAGRVCWAVAGTLCGGKVQGIFAMKIETCLQCPFLKLVADNEDADFVLRPEEVVPEISEPRKASSQEE